MIPSAPASTIFAITRGSRTFIGASPERLVSLRGRELRTMAMAGSARRGLDRATDEALAAELMASDKEREEHAVVVAMLREALAPVTEELLFLARASFVVVGTMPWWLPLARAALPLGPVGQVFDLLFVVVCHRLPDRTLDLAGVAMPVCSRCAEASHNPFFGCR